MSESKTTFGTLAGGRIFTENNRPDPKDETHIFPQAMIDKAVVPAAPTMCQEGWFPSSEVNHETVRGYIRALERHIQLVEGELGAMKMSLRVFKERLRG